MPGVRCELLHIDRQCLRRGLPIVRAGMHGRPAYAAVTRIRSKPSAGRGGWHCSPAFASTDPDAIAPVGTKMSFHSSTSNSSKLVSASVGTPGIATMRFAELTASAQSLYGCGFSGVSAFPVSASLCHAPDSGCDITMAGIGGCHHIQELIRLKGYLPFSSRLTMGRKPQSWTDEKAVNLRNSLLPFQRCPPAYTIFQQSDPDRARRMAPSTSPPMRNLLQG